MLLGADGGLDDIGVEGVGDQGDGEVNLLQSLVKSSIVGDIEGDGLGVLEAFAELLSTLEGSAGCWGIVDDGQLCWVLLDGENSIN